MVVLDKIEPRLYYAAVSQSNIIAPAKDLMTKGALYLNRRKENPTIETKIQGHDVSTPWIFELEAVDRYCTLWHKIWWMNYSFCPLGCHKCWKIVVIPETLKQLFALREYQEKLHLPSKCGMDIRKYTNQIYSGYWYSPLDKDLDHARKLYQRVAKGVKNEVGDIPVFLKRGCTEMEMGKGPSDKWVYTPQMAMTEKMLLSMYKLEHYAAPASQQPVAVKMDVIQRWIEWAWEHGDPTVHEFINRPLCPPPVTYHDSDHKVEMFEEPDDENDSNSVEVGESLSRPEQGIVLV